MSAESVPTVEAAASDERDRLIAILEGAISWGYVRAGNAYARPQKPKHQPEPLDVAPDDAPHG